jgi:hypothetical protein
MIKSVKSNFKVTKVDVLGIYQNYMRFTASIIDHNTEFGQILLSKVDETCGQTDGLMDEYIAYVRSLRPRVQKTCTGIKSNHNKCPYHEFQDEVNNLLK